MRVLAISHQRDAGPGVFADGVAARGAKLDVWHIGETGEPPADPGSYDAVLTFGGAMHADQDGRHPWIEPEKRLLAELLDHGTPLLGVCLGSQLLAGAAGGGAARASEPEIGWFGIEVTAQGREDPLLGELAPRFEAFEWHSYECLLPEAAVVLATTPVCVQAYRLGESAWGIQFHAEVTAADVAKWISEYDSDEDAVRTGVDPVALADETAAKIEAFSELGRGLCARWLAAAG